MKKFFLRHKCPEIHLHCLDWTQNSTRTWQIYASYQRVFIDLFSTLAHSNISRLDKLIWKDQILHHYLLIDLSAKRNVLCHQEPALVRSCTNETVFFWGLNSGGFPKSLNIYSIDQFQLQPWLESSGEAVQEHPAWVSDERTKDLLTFMECWKIKVMSSWWFPVIVCWGENILTCRSSDAS